MSATLASRWVSDPMERTNLVLSMAAVGASLAVASPRFVVSLAIGIVLAFINFRLLRQASRRLFARELTSGGAWVGLFAIRFALLGAAMYVALDAGVNPFGLLLGLSLMVPAAVWVGWRSQPAVSSIPEIPVPPPDDPSWDDWNPWLARPREPEPPYPPSTPGEVDA